MLYSCHAICLFDRYSSLSDTGGDMSIQSTGSESTTSPHHFIVQKRLSDARGEVDALVQVMVCLNVKIHKMHCMHEIHRINIEIQEQIQEFAKGARSLPSLLPFSYIAHPLPLRSRAP